MAADLRGVLEILWGALGLGPAPATPADSEEFELEDAICRVERAPSGTEVLISMPVGTLVTDPHVAADRLRRLFRLCLGLALVNRAALVCTEKLDDARLRQLQMPSDRPNPLAFRAVAVVRSTQRAEVFAALQDVVQLRSLALSYLAADSAAAGSDPFSRPLSQPQSGRDDSASMIIFQP